MECVAGWVAWGFGCSQEEGGKGGHGCDRLIVENVLYEISITDSAALWRSSNKNSRSHVFISRPKDS